MSFPYFTDYTGATAAATAGFCLFVYNLGPETEDSSLWQLFGPFGAVLSVKVNLVNQIALSNLFPEIL